MKIATLTIGNELTSGKTQDSNAFFIARNMQLQGWQVTAMLSVGDDDQAIKGALDFLLGVADGLIVTGGLGPTTDDITSAAIARAFGLALETDEEVLKHVKERMTSRNRVWIPNNAKQAMFPEGAETIVNTIGTAWGFSLKIGGKIIAVIPGVPKEAEKMLVEGVIPRFRREFAVHTHVLTRIIKLAGVSESAIDQLLADVPFDELGVNIGFYPRFPELEVVLTARDADRNRALDKLKRTEDQVVPRISQHVFAFDQETLEGIVAALLIEKKRTIALAESCTGGLIADRLTDIPGSSAYFDRALVTYSTHSKKEHLGIPDEVIKKFGTVSRETAMLMAEGVRRVAKTDLGLSTTGFAGPSGGTVAEPLGTIYIALADGQKTDCQVFSFPWDRRRNKVLTSQWALMLLRKYLTAL